MSAPHQIRRCAQASCGLRFPVPAGSELGASCPHCGGPTSFADPPYSTHEIHEADPPLGPPVEALLDNVRSLRNVGSMFRTADGAGVRHLHLGGFTPTPEHPQMAKTALGAERSVPWTRHADALEAAQTLAAKGLRVWAVEGGPRAVPLATALATRDDRAILLVFGHEVSGVDPRIVDVAERVVRLPMSGVKGSLNVGVAFGVACYFVRHGA